MDVKLDNVFLNYKRHEMTLTMAYDFLMPSLVMLEVHILQTRNGQERTEVIMETTWQQISWLLMMLYVPNIFGNININGNFNDDIMTLGCRLTKLTQLFS